MLTCWRSFLALLILMLFISTQSHDRAPAMSWQSVCESRTRTICDERPASSTFYIAKSACGKRFPRNGILTFVSNQLVGNPYLILVTGHQNLASDCHARFVHVQPPHMPFTQLATCFPPPVPRNARCGSLPIPVVASFPEVKLKA